MEGATNLSAKFCKDLNWFAAYLLHTNRVYISHQENRVSIPVYVDACSMGGVLPHQVSTHHH